MSNFVSKIPKFFNFSRKKHINRDIFGQKLRMKDVSLIYFSFTNWQFLCNCLLLYKPSQVAFVKLKPDFGKFHRWSIFCINSCFMKTQSCFGKYRRWGTVCDNFLKILPEPKIFYTGATCDKIMSVKLGKGSKEWKKNIYNQLVVAQKDCDS